MKKNPTLPLELIREILLRLPVRSLLRFKCVCKSWFSLISDPQFGVSHYDLAAAPTYRILLGSNRFYIESIDIDAPKLSDKSSAVHFLVPPSSPPHPLHLYNYFHADRLDVHDILGSCRGLIAFYYEKCEDLIIWNPSIGVHKRFPKFQYPQTNQLLYGFGYDPSTDDYLLIHISFDSESVETGIQIFSFRTESVNRICIDSPYENKILHVKFGAGLFLNGALHWLVLCKDKRVIVIIAFDLVQRSLSEIPLFDDFTAERHEQIYGFRVMGGCLSVCCSVQDGEAVEIWVMKEYKVKSSWTKSIVIHTYGELRSRFSPICITKDGRIFGSNTSGIFKLNEKGERLDYVTCGGGELYEANLQSAMYRESLLSLPTSPPRCHMENM